MKRTFIIVFTLFAMVFAGSAIAQDQTTNTGVIVPGIGQGQGQGQSQAINGPLFVDNTVNEAADLSKGRGFAIPGEMVFPGTPGYFGEATPGHRFIPLNKLLMFTTVWDVAKAKQMLAGYDGMKDIEIRDLVATDDTLELDKVYCGIAMPQELGATSVDQLSIGAIAATSKASISADVFAAAVVAAADRKANYIMFMAEGVNREVVAQGFGIGFNFTRATLTGPGTNEGSNVGTGGLGYSKGWAGYTDNPWLQFTFLNVEGIDNLPVAAAPPAPEVEEAPEKPDQKYLIDYMRDWGWIK